MGHILWVKLNGLGPFGYGWGTWKCWKYWKRSGTRFWVKLCHSPSTIFLKNCAQFFVHKPVLKFRNSLKNCFEICNHVALNFCVKNERRNGSKFNWKFVTVWNKRVPNLAQKYCTENSWIWCRFLVSSFAQKLVPIGGTIFVIGLVSILKKYLIQLYAKLKDLRFHSKLFLASNFADITLKNFCLCLWEVIVVWSTLLLNFVPKIWNKIVAKISVRSIPSDAEIFASNSVAKKKSNSCKICNSSIHPFQNFWQNGFMNSLGSNCCYENFW